MRGREEGVAGCGCVGGGQAVDIRITIIIQLKGYSPPRSLKGEEGRTVSGPSQRRLIEARVSQRSCVCTRVHVMTTRRASNASEGLYSCNWLINPYRARLLGQGRGCVEMQAAR